MMTGVYEFPSSRFILPTFLSSNTSLLSWKYSQYRQYQYYLLDYQWPFFLSFKKKYFFRISYMHRVYFYHILPLSPPPSLDFPCGYLNEKYPLRLVNLNTCSLVSDPVGKVMEPLVGEALLKVCHRL